MMNSIWSIILSLLVISASLIPGLFIPANRECVTAQTISTPKKHIIENVPYVSQESDFYCAYASPTMIFQYYGINTSLDEVLFNSGVGYSFVYSPPFLPRFPIGCIGASKWEKDRRFLAHLYGLTYDSWRPERTLSETDQWNTYWDRVKQNISNDIPLVTNTDPVYLISIRNAIRKELGISEGIWTRTADILWELVPSGFYHAIVLVGYNEHNGTVCFHDPAAALFGPPEAGTYTWMNLSKFRQALSSLSKQTALSYLVGSFHNTATTPMNKTDAFLLAHARNLKKMRGNLSVYDDRILYEWDCSNLGIRGLRELQKDLGDGISSRITTMYLYKAMCLWYGLPITYRLCYLFNRTVPSVVDLSACRSVLNYYQQFVIEKQSIAQYLHRFHQLVNDTNITALCEHDILLFEQERQNWTELAESFSVFLQRGPFLTVPYALPYLADMEQRVDDVISLEEAIIDDTS